MVIWVAELAEQAVGREHVYIATDDERIREKVKKAGFSVVMTGEEAATGTDRLAEAAETLDYEIFINLQGDEPLVDPEDIKRVLARKRQEPECIVNAYCYVGESEDPTSVNLPKVVSTEDDYLVYMSRAALPACKDSSKGMPRYKKQVCIYAFSKEDLRVYRGFGRKSEVEKYEDIEILRFLEFGKKVALVEVSGGSLAVDIPEDVDQVEAELRRRHVY
jgi:3-deoxy-manno-octulosonate cytidylyltransferase (CMP-KDO synthetase)